MSARARTAGLADETARRCIREDLDRTLVVEAAAGTGKTTELIKRIVAVLAAGHAGARVDSIVAVTFTERAAGELKLRLRAALERARREAKDDPATHANLEEALARLEEARVSTIHGFCADLLRERSVDARVDPRFETLAEGEAERFWRGAFDRWLEKQLEDPPEGVRRSLRRVAKGMDPDGPIGRLRAAGWMLAEWRDFPAPWRRPPFDREAAIDALVTKLHAFADLTERCAEPGRDNLYRDTERARVASREIRAAEEVAPRDHDGVEAALIALPERNFNAPRKGFGKSWSEGVTRQDVLTAHAELVAGLKAFTAAADADLAALLHAELAGAIARYERRKRRAGRVDFVDLLLAARDLLRDRQEVRAEFQRRFTHVFVDEFQDTDPLQAEILLLLVADDPHVADWRAATPVPGKLFLVGDPKQSIYRFRRADVGVYLDVRDRLVAGGAECVRLTTSFRGVRTIQRAVNAAFGPVMTGDPEAQQAEYVPLSESREDPEGQPALVALPVPAPYGRRGSYTKTAIEESLPGAVAAFVHWLLTESGWTVTERDDELGGGDGDGAAERRVPVEARHVCLLFRRLKSFGRDVSREYVEELEARDVRHVLVGGRSFHEREEVESIRTAMCAIEWPDDELSVFATLRGAFLAVGDEELLEWRHLFGRVHPFRVPEEVPAHLEDLRTALSVLADLHRRRNERPVAETVHELLAATRAHAALVLRTSGEQALANVLHVAEQARDYEASGGISFRGFVERLLEEAGARQAGEAPILEEGSDGVRIMTVHKAKGLEFPVVVLADMTASLASEEPGRALDPEHGKCALRIAGWAPAELADHRGTEVKRDVAEGLRLAYVAATRARDLLVVPVLGDGPWMTPDDGPRASWFAPIASAMYPPRDRWAAAEPAVGAPRFGRDSVCDRPHDPGDGGVRPGRHDLDGWSAVWWDPHALALRAEPAMGVRHPHLLAKEADEALVAEDLARYEAWREGRAGVRNRGAEPALRVETATARARRTGAPGAGAPPVERVDLPRERKRPAGPRFGTLVHAVLAAAPLDADADGVQTVALLQARMLAAPEPEARAAARIASAVLRHPLLERAREAAKRGECRREAPVTWRDPDGALVEGVVDLAFRERAEWTVVDFKTDADTAGAADVYRAQLALYVTAVAAATGEPARGILLGV